MLLGRSAPQIMPSQPVADVFYNAVNITKVRANKAYWADGGIVSTTQNIVGFLKALDTGQIIRGDSLQLMHNWRQLENQPFQHGYGTHYFALPAPANALLGATPVWGHTGSVGSFLYYSEDLDLYLAGGIDQTENNAAPIMLMLRVMGAVWQLS